MKRYGITLENALTLVVSLKTSYFGSWLLTSSSFVDINLYFVTFVSTESPWTASLLPRRDGVPCCLGQCLRLWSPRVQPAAERPAGPAEAARPLALQLPSGAAALRRGIGYFRPLVTVYYLVQICSFWQYERITGRKAHRMYYTPHDHIWVYCTSHDTNWVYFFSYDCR